MTATAVKKALNKKVSSQTATEMIQAKLVRIDFEYHLDEVNEQNRENEKNLAEDEGISNKSWIKAF